MKQRQRPLKYDRLLHVRVPSWLYEKIEEESEKRCVPVSSVIRPILVAHYAMGDLNPRADWWAATELRTRYGVAEEGPDDPAS